MFYVTTYEEYPIYNPAEGGYYYEGIEIKDSKGFRAYNNAKRYIEELYYEETKNGENNNEHWRENLNRTYFGCGSKYIGEGWYVIIEFEQGHDVIGAQPYC